MSNDSSPACRRDATPPRRALTSAVPSARGAASSRRSATVQRGTPRSAAGRWESGPLEVDLATRRAHRAEGVRVQPEGEPEQRDGEAGSRSPRRLPLAFTSREATHARRRPATCPRCGSTLEHCVRGGAQASLRFLQLRLLRQHGSRSRGGPPPRSAARTDATVDAPAIERRPPTSARSRLRRSAGQPPGRRRGDRC